MKLLGLSYINVSNKIIKGWITTRHIELTQDCNYIIRSNKNMIAIEESVNDIKEHNKVLFTYNARNKCVFVNYNNQLSITFKIMKILYHIS